MNIEKKTPSAKELLEATQVECNQQNCNKVFNNYGNLYLHLRKHHKLEIKDTTKSPVRQQFYCPELPCKYNIISNNGKVFFISKKYLRQHYLKVHATKSIKCKTCEKSFASETLKNVHQSSCGQEFKCFNCDWKYQSREALLTHCRRKGHASNKPPHRIEVTIQVPDSITEEKRIVSGKYKNIAPKKTSSEVQTPWIFQSTKNSKICQMTQTKRKDKPSAAESKSQGSNTKKFLDTWNKRVNPSTTSTATSPPTTKNTFRNLDFFDTESNNLITSSSQTDRNLNNLNFVEDSLMYFGSETFQADLCHIETQTEFNQFFHTNTTTTSVSDTSAPNLEAVCATTIATQATDHLDQMLYSHMHTQTCDEILSDLGWTDIQTQTNWAPTDYSELLVSTETQTSFSACLLENPSTYTQTGRIGRGSIFENRIITDISNYSTQCTQTT